MQQTFCTSTSPHQPSHYGMDLDIQLGHWRPVPCHSWFDVYRSPTALFWQIESIICKLRSALVPGFFIIDTEIDTLPLDSHPINFQRMGDYIYTHRRYTITTPPPSSLPPEGITLHNTISNTNQSLTIGCDASLHVSLHISTCAWVVETPELEQLQAYVNLQHLSSLTTYRGKLEGIYCSLRHVHDLGYLPPHIRQWCDNKAAIENAARDLYNPSQMLQPDADILLAISTLRHKFHCSLTQQHVYGHQDSRRPANCRDTPHSLLSSSSQDSFSNMSISGAEHPSPSMHATAV